MMVTVVCITYKHEEYLAQALESFLMQKTNFKFQIFVGDDCSPDNTAAIIKEYAEKYPDTVIPFIREKNMGAQRNLVDLCSHASSPYIAFCEGDDYWTDEKKLQKQFDYMEKHKELRACFHNAEIIAGADWYLRDYYIPDSKGRLLIPYGIPSYKKKLKTLDMRYYILIGAAHTSSMFFRWNYSLEIPEWYYTHFAGDHSMMMLQTGIGKIGFIPDIMSAYRRSEVGVIFFEDKVQHMNKTRLSWIRMLSDLKDYFISAFGDEEQGQKTVRSINTRIKTEARNYLESVSASGSYDDIREKLEQNDRGVITALKAVNDISLESRVLRKGLGGRTMDLLVNNPKWMKMLAPFTKIYTGAAFRIMKLFGKAKDV